MYWHPNPTYPGPYPGSHWPKYNPPWYYPVPIPRYCPHCGERVYPYRVHNHLSDVTTTHSITVKDCENSKVH